MALAILAMTSIVLLADGCDEPFGLRHGTYRVRLYSGNVIVKEWRTNNHHTLHGLTQFVDIDTGQEVAVSGNVIIDKVATPEKQ